MHRYNGLFRRNESVYVKGKHWDGIDTADHIDVGPLSATEARDLAVGLVRLADEADAYTEEVRRAVLTDKKSRLAALKAEVASLEHEVGGE